MKISNGDRRRRLARRQRLTPSTRAESVTAVADSMVALHSSDPVTVYLAVAARSESLTVGDVEQALYEDRSVLRHHAMRRTLWVSTVPVSEIMHAACTRKVAEQERRRNAKLVGDPAWFDEAVRQVIECVNAADSPVTTRAIGQLVPELRREIVYGAGTKNEATGSAHTRAVLQAAFDGELVRTRPAGTWIASQYAWLDRARWTPVDWTRHSTHAGMTGLVNAWLETFGPGTLEDLVWWTGTTKTAVRAALAELDIAEVDLSSGPGLMLASDLAADGTAEEVEPWAALLPGLDPTSMGWKERSWYLDEASRRRVVDRFGNIGPTVWVDGRVVGGWAQRPDGEIAIELTSDIPPARHELIDSAVQRVTEFVGDARFRVRFPSPNQPDLLA